MSGKIEISRELAEQALRFLMSPGDGWEAGQIAQELRALLVKADDADKVNNREMGLMQFVDKHAAPVVERQPVMKLEAERMLGPDGEYAVSFVKAGWLDECRKKGGTFLLYAEQPAPVSVRLPAYHEPHSGQPLTEEQIGFNLAIDWVKELNQ